MKILVDNSDRILGFAMIRNDWIRGGRGLWRRFKQPGGKAAIFVEAPRRRSCSSYDGWGARPASRECTDAV